ncbi:MAG: hypothetical protein ACP5K6_08235 [Dictyoglomus sp.]|jgi:uncharacterized membrane protein|uniref:hypothetical protein n=1 Tax=Dictyoglomus sp. TaxID=28205 RepID=UPI003D0EE8D0
MNSEVSRSIFKIGFFISFLSGIMIPFLEVGTATFVVDILAFISGTLIMILSLFIRKYFR